MSAREGLPNADALDCAMAELAEAEGTLRDREAEVRNAEKARDAARAGVGRAIADARRALRIPASQMARMMSLSGTVAEYAEIEDGQRWSKYEVEQIIRSIRVRQKAESDQ